MALFLDVARLAEELAGEGGRLKKRAAIAEAIGRVAGERTGAELKDAGLFAMYLAGTPFPESDQRNLNAGGALLSKAVKEVSGATDAELGAAYRRHGDLGAAASDVLVTKDAGKTAAVTLGEVEAAFAGMAVAATTKVRAGLVEGLLHRATAIEAKYLLKLMLGDMRIGVKQSLVEEAIAVAASRRVAGALDGSGEGPGSPPVEVAAVRHVVMLEADLAGAVRRAFEGTLAEARMRLFHPLGFMLASPVETPEEAVERFTAKPRKAVEVATPKKRVAKKKKGAVEEEAAEEFADVGAVDVLAAPVAVEAERLAVEVGEVAEPVAGRVEAYLEDKYDGMRAQLHCGDAGQPGRVAIYSRNRDEVTESFPELEEAFGQVSAAAVGESGVILDGEILGWDFAEGKALPFAVLGQRIGRKRVGNDVRRAIPVVFMAFDVMYADGALTLGLPLRDRRDRLERAVTTMEAVAVAPLELPEIPKAPKAAKAKRGTKAGQSEIFAAEAAGPSCADADVRANATGVGFKQGSEFAAPAASQPGVARLMISPAKLVETAEEIDRAYADARARANEGVMLKAAGSPYLPGRRGLLWVKLKRELATLDVVITGAEYGTGRRSQLLSDYTFAVRGPGGELLNVGKAYSGVTDAEILELTEWLKAHTLEEYGHFRTVEPLRLLEVAFNNIMRSDRHASGFALRFPRIVRLRDDKPVSEIDTLARVEEVYQSQVDKPAEA